MSKYYLIGYGIFMLIFSAFSYTFIDPNLSFLKFLFNGFAYSNRLATTIIYTLFICLFYAFYIFFIRHAQRKEIDSLLFKKMLIVISILVFSYPAMLSYDIFNYVLTAKTTFYYKENPYLVMPIEFVGDPLLEFTRATNKVALYGPTWILLTAIPWLFSFGNFIGTLLGLKILVLCFYLGTLVLLYKLNQNKIALVLFALNPLVIVETLVSSHNDIVMVFLLLASYFFLKKKNIILGLFLFLLSVFVKFATVILLPIILFVVWKHIKKESIDWNTVFFHTAILLFIVFLLSPIREELYPWYFIWVLPFIYLLPEKKKLIQFSIVLSFCLLLRYIPYMYTGTYSGLTPIIRNVFMIVPLVLLILYSYFKKNTWLKN